jgi:hypothetical protein
VNQQIPSKSNLFLEISIWKILTLRLKRSAKERRGKQKKEGTSN